MAYSFCRLSVWHAAESYEKAQAAQVSALPATDDLPMVFKYLDLFIY